VFGPCHVRPTRNWKTKDHDGDPAWQLDSACGLTFCIFKLFVKFPFGLVLFASAGAVSGRTAEQRGKMCTEEDEKLLFL